MSATPDESLPLRVQATLPEAEVRAAKAWDQLQEREPRFDSHPLSELLEDESTIDDQAEVA